MYQGRNTPNFTCDEEEARETQVSEGEGSMGQVAAERLLPFQIFGRWPDVAEPLFSGVFLGPRRAVLSVLREGWPRASKKTRSWKQRISGNWGRNVDFIKWWNYRSGGDG